MQYAYEIRLAELDDDRFGEVYATREALRKIGGDPNELVDLAHFVLGCFGLGDFGDALYDEEREANLWAMLWEETGSRMGAYKFPCGRVLRITSYDAPTERHPLTGEWLPRIVTLVHV